MGARTRPRRGNQWVLVCSLTLYFLLGNAVGSATSDPANGKIAFVSDRGGDGEIYVMDADGSNVVQLTDNSRGDSEPSWSQDGSQIAFTSNRDGDPEIYVMDADGGNVAQLTHNGVTDGIPTWSPDGTKIAWTSTLADPTSRPMTRLRLCPEAPNEALVVDSPAGNRPAARS